MTTPLRHIWGNLYISDWQVAARVNPDEFERITVAFDSPFKGEHYFAVVDGPSEDNALEIPLAVQKTVDLLLHDKKVLVHCMAGRSRSAAVVVGVLMKHGFGFMDALQVVTDKHPDADPKWSLLKILLGW